ncbi:hypothetical protein C0991_007829, partial [Blastosporella zonata]
MLSDLKTKGLYIRERWAGFPQNKEKEKSFYTPFADTANAIVRSIPGNDTVKTNMLYLDIHDITPTSQNPQTPIGRPDGAAATVNTKVMAVNEEIKKQERIIQGTGVTVAAKEKAKLELSKQNSEMETLMKGYKPSWMGIHVPYEIKPKKSHKDWHGAVDQAMTYIGHVFMEQLDRRFAFALVLCRDELTILMCDRSGLMVTKTPINIHKEPEMFIRVMAAFSCMSAAQLGWDTDMKIYLPKSSPDPVPSYQVDPDDIEGKELHWVIDVVVNGQVEPYVTVGVISTMRSVEICSRATIVYEVIKYNERSAPTETFALKRYWLPLVAGDQAELYPWEGEIYESLHNGRPTEEKHVLASHKIEIGGELDTTFTLIRRGLDGTRLMKGDVAVKGSKIK